MSKTSRYDAKISQILDATEPGERVCELTGEKWTMTEEEIEWFKRFGVPPSRMSPRTRWNLAIGFYIGYQWWWNKHPETGKPILSGTHPATGIKVLPDKEWFERDFSEKGIEYQVDQSFFDQFRKLQLDVPLTATRNFEETENSISFVSSGDINSYFVLACQSRNSLFSVSSGKIERSCLINWTNTVFDSYFVSDAGRIHNSKFVIDSGDVIDSCFTMNCVDISNCFMATSQNHKKYIWKDEQLSEGEYKKRIAEVDFSSRTKMQEYIDEFFDYLRTKAIWPESIIVNSPGCDGEYIVDCLNLKHSYSCANGARDCYWVIQNYEKSEYNAFVTGAYGTSESFYSSGLAECQSCRYSNQLKSCRNLEYCTECFNCEDCFGCVGLNRKRFHIFNKEYSEDEYWTRVDELKCAMLDRGEYGDFFPLKFSPSYQPQCGPALYLLTTDEEFEKLGALQFDPESEGAIGQDLEQVGDYVKSSDIPDRFPDNADEWVGKPIIDEKANRRFSFIKPEIEFYKKHGLPLPDKHFVRRFQELNWIMNGARFETRECSKCSKTIQTAINKTFPDRTVYCMDCYFKYLEERG